MERQHLIKLIENKGTSSKEETAELWDIVRTFPYFQTARLLLARSFHKQSSIHFHSELKVAAAYAADRKVLFNLIKEQPDTASQKTTPNTNVFALEVNQPIEPYIENQFILPEESKEQTETPLFEIKEDVSPIAESKMEYVEEQKVREEDPIEENTFIPEAADTYHDESRGMSIQRDEPASTPEEIIRRRLSEILSKNKPEQQEKEEFADGNLQTTNSELPTSLESPVANDETPVHTVLEDLPSKPADTIEGLEIETIIEESYLQELEKLPEIVKPLGQKEEINQLANGNLQTANSQLPTSFIDWLKQKNAKETTLEEVIDEPGTFHHEIEKTPEKHNVQSSELINRFIETTPRIVPVKAEFYSPANMARQSITDNEDIISETLARIYFDQQNYPKALSCYEKLSLLYPEKSASFAPLIEKIDHLIRNQS